MFLLWCYLKYNKKILKKQKYFLYICNILIYMIIIDLSKERNLESALRTYKSKVQKTKQVQKLRARQQFVKPSVVRREEMLKAKYVQQMKNGLN